MIKKCISFFIAVVFCVNMAFAYENSGSDYEGAVYAEAVETLNGLGIISFFEDGTFRPEQSYSRADCAAVMIKLKGFSEKEIQIGNNYPWIDVNDETASVGAILKAYELGIIVGDGDGYYHPDKAVTMQQLEVMLVKILGYEKMAEQYGGFPLGYEKLASDLKLLKGVSGDSSQAVSRGNAAIMIYNALDINMMQYDLSGDVSVSIKDGITILSEYMDIEKGTAQIEANDRTSLPGYKKVGKGQIMLGGSSVYKGETNANDYLGYIVTYYLNTDADTLVYITPDRNKNSEVTVNASELCDEAVNENITRLYYYDGDKEKSYRLSSTLDVVYNGCVDNDFNTDSFDIIKGNIKLLDVEDDGIYDIAFINEYRDYLITAADGYNNKLYGLYDREINLSEEAEVIFKNEKGDSVDWTTLETNQVASVYASKDENYIRAYISSEQISGKVDSVYNKDGDKILKISNGDVYKLEDIPELEIAKISAGSEIILYLNIYGDVAAFEIDTTGTMKYGYLLKASKSDEGENEGVIKFIDIASQKYVEAKFDEKIKLNGKTRTSGGSRYTFDLVFDEALSSGDKTEPQVIKYKMNSEGKITKINTAVGTEYIFNGEKLVKAYSGSAAYITSAQTLGGRYKMDDTTLRIFLPSKNEAGTYDKDLISYNMTLWNANSYSVQVYDVDETYIPKLVVFSGVTKTTENTRNIAVIKEITEQCDEDGEIYTCLRCFYAGSEVEFRLNDELSGSNLEPGYIVTLVRDEKGRVTSYTRIFDLNKEEALDSTINAAGAVDFYSYYYGLAYKKNQSYMTFKYDKLDNMRLAIFGGSANIYRYDSKSKNKVSKATTAEIVEKVSRVFVNTNEGITRDIVIVN